MVASMWVSLKMTSIYINGEGRLVQTMEAKDFRIFSTLQKLWTNPSLDWTGYDKRNTKTYKQLIEKELYL